MSSAGHRLSDIAKAVGGTFTGEDAHIAHLSIDSRKAITASDTLFIALRGERHDGHRYINELIARGMRHFMVMEDAELDAVTDALGVIRVPDTIAALQTLAGWHRAKFQMRVVGITGSNGKTVVKEWLFHLLRDAEHIVRSPGSWNSQVGVPLSVWNMRTEHTLGIFEAGISKPGEMEKLRAVIQPTIGVFTNIGPAHDAGFANAGEKAREKALLFTDAEAVVYCDDHQHIKEALLAQRNLKRTLLAWSRGDAGFVQVLGEEAHGAGMRIHARHAGSDFAFDIPFADQAAVENAMHCVTLLLHLGRSPEWIAQRTPHLPAVSMRLETVEGVHGTTLLNDAYSNDTASLAIALDHLGTLAAGRSKAVVLSDIVDQGGNADARYQQVEQLLRRVQVDIVLTVGPELAARAMQFAPRVEHFSNAGQLLSSVDPSSIADHVVLVKGARAFELERVVERWQRHMHGTVLEVDLEAVRHNLNHYRTLVQAHALGRTGEENPLLRRGQGEAKGVRIMAMVKAFGYGSGALELARLFAHEQVHYLGVAYADEGVDLRQNGIDLPILVMNPEPVPFEVLHRFRLETEVYDLRSLREAQHAAKHLNDAPPVHLKLDTGMHRLGFTRAELPELLNTLRAGQALSGVEGRGEGNLRVASILSHMVATEDPAEDTFTRKQIELFVHMAGAIGDVLGYKPLWHMANSAGITRWPSAHFDMVRLGIGLHGIGADANETAQLQASAALRTPIAQIKQLTTGDTVGYNRRGIITGDRTIATLPIGYADGLLRTLGNGTGRVWINGKAAPIVGNVCMDMCMVDVTGIACAVGDLATVFDAAHPVSELARDMGTIPYEVLTSISQRVKRVYLRG